MSFIGRERELAVLEEALAHPGSSLIPIYGRRRVGKSEMIRHFLGDRPALCVVGKRAPAPLQMREFLGEAARLTGEPLLADLPATDWKRALLSAWQRWRGPGKLVLALDEFQWMAEASPELPSVIQELWDLHFKRAGNVLLLLCGSYVGFMEREVLGRKSPLFGRRTAQIHLKPFPFREAAAFHRDWSLADVARVRFICGGVPLYLRFFDPGRSIESSLCRVVLDEYGPLFREPEFLLREELRDVENYFAVLLAIAGGETRAAGIAAASGVPERSLHYYLQQLSELGYVQRRHPLADGRPALRQVRYVLEDPLLRFWFRFVFPNLSFLQFAGPARTLAERIRPGLDAYWGACFEGLCREALPLIYFAEGVAVPFEVGEYWGDGIQIDVVGRREDNWTDLGECCWGRVGSVRALRDELEARVSSYPNRRGATIGRRFFLRTKPAGPLPVDRNTSWFDLEGLYGGEEGLHGGERAVPARHARAGGGRRGSRAES